MKKFSHAAAHRRNDGLKERFLKPGRRRAFPPLREKTF
jgi:hypothetical protein